MKWFGDIPALKFTDFYKLTGVQPDVYVGEVTEWEFIERVGHIMDDYSYCIFRHLPTGKLYRNCWGVISPDGSYRPTGQYNSKTDYWQLVEVRAEKVTVYTKVKK